MKQVTIREIAQAMTRDTFPKAISTLVAGEVEYHGGPVVEKHDYIEIGGGLLNAGSHWKVLNIGSTCAIGGAALELGVEPLALQDALSEVDIDGVPVPESYATLGTPGEDDEMSLGKAIWFRNDMQDMNKQDIGNLVLATADEETLDTVLEVKEAPEVLLSLYNEAKAKHAGA